MLNYAASQKVRVLAFGALVVFGGGSLLDGTTASAAGRPAAPAHMVVPANAAPGKAAVDATLPADDEAKGLVRKGLAVGRPDGPCKGLLEIVGPDGSSPSQCTHGPDAAPNGVDVRAPRTLEDIAFTTKAGATLAGTTGATVPCYGDGVTGNRIQAVYARSSDKPDRYSSIAPMIAQWAANADAVFNNSAAKTGGIRHLRWVTDAGCSLDVARVTLSPTGDDNLYNTEIEMQSLGFDRGDRKYMIWMDANVYCGIADMRSDDLAGPNNSNNYGRTWARVDSGCWGYYDSPEAHEIMHMMGGVQGSAPHVSYAWHCTDESDRMCYSDGPGVTMNYVCGSSEELLFDCNNDDYFHTSPSPTSYLGTHWNSAMNVFLEQTGPAAPAPTTTTTTVPPTTVPGTSTTTKWTGTLKGGSLLKDYGVASGAGTMVASATYTGGGSSVTLTVKNSGGSIVGQKSGSSGSSLSVSVPAGSYTVTISGARNTSYSLSVTRPAP